jgi:hypothetical protein
VLGAVILLLWLAMRFCGVLKRIPRDSGVELLTRTSGLCWPSRSGDSWNTAEEEARHGGADRTGGVTG